MNEFLQRPSVETFYLLLATWCYQGLSWMASVIPEVLLGTRGTCHLLIFMLVVGYRSPYQEHRRIIGAIAGIFAGANAAEAYRIAMNFGTFSSIVQPPLTIIMLCFLFFIAYARGNVAKLLPRSLKGA